MCKKRVRHGEGVDESLLAAIRFGLHVRYDDRTPGYHGYRTWQGLPTNLQFPGVNYSIRGVPELNHDLTFRQGFPIPSRLL